jgi:hypothetical protein
MRGCTIDQGTHVAQAPPLSEVYTDRRMDQLTRALHVINGMVNAGIIRKYAVAGAVAALNYIEPAVTEDLDVLISVEDFEDRTSGITTLGPLISYLAGLGYSEFKKEGIVIEGWPVQFLPVANSLDAEALAQAVEVEIEPDRGSQPVKVRVLSPEHLVATALKIGRPKDRERVLRFVEEKAVNLSRLRSVLARHDLLKVWAKFRHQTGLPDFDESA